MSGQDVTAIQAQSDAFADAIVRAYGPERARVVLLQAVKRLLERADTVSRDSAGRLRERRPPSQF